MYAASGQGGDLLEDGGRDVDGAEGADGTLVDDLGGRVEIPLRDLDHLAAGVGRALELAGGERDHSVGVRAGLAAGAETRLVVGEIAVEGEDDAAERAE